MGWFRMTASLRDVAQRAQVAASTVSRVINGSPRISAETAQRVWDAIAALNYRVDPIARQNIRRRWHHDKPRGGMYRLAVLHPTLNNELAAPFYYDILYGMQARILESRLALAGLYDRLALKNELHFFQAIDPLEVDGLLLIDVNDPRLLDRLLSRVSTAVLVNHPGTPTQDSVCFDYRQAIITMVQHLAGLGHRHIAYLGRRIKTDQGYASAERTRGYLQAMKELGYKVPPNYVVDSTTARLGGFVDQWNQFQALKPRPTALVCASDRIAIEMLRHFTKAGLRVPQDVALGSYENLDVASYMIPRLTTMHTPRRELGATAVDLLTRRLADPTAPIRHEVLRTHLVVRESCGSPAAST